VPPNQACERSFRAVIYLALFLPAWALR